MDIASFGTTPPLGFKTPPVNSFMNNLLTADSKRDVEISPHVNISMSKENNLRVFSTGRRISPLFRATQEEVYKKREEKIEIKKSN